MKLGAQAYTIRDYLNTADECRESYKKVAAMGYDNVQTWASGGLTVQQLKDILTEAGLTNCSAGGDFDKMLAGDATALKDAVEGARLFNTQYIGVPTMSEEYQKDADGMKRYAQALNTIAGHLQKEGCKVLYHHHALEFLSLGAGKNGMDVLVEETDPVNVLWTLDTHWLTSAGVDPVAWIKRMKGRVPIIHFKDYAIDFGVELIEGVNKNFAEVGEGNINWPPIVAAVKESDIDYVVVEQDSCKGNPFDSLKTSFAALKRFGL